MTRHWLAVASAEHVRIGRAQGFMQVCHGKAAALRRIKPGDWVAYYSPTDIFGGKDRLRAFTALGVVKAQEPYQVEMARGFCPFRRDVDWLAGQEAPIESLLDELDLTAGKRNWGYQLRFGLLAIGDRDVQTIATAMKIELPKQLSPPTAYNSPPGRP